MIFAAILAGGTGTRMGAGLPKQFLHLNQKPVVVHTLQHFADCSELDGIFLLVPEDWVEFARVMAAEYFPRETRLQVLSGGIDRTDSLRKAMEAAAAVECTEETILITHDAVRPMIDPALIRATVAAAQSIGGATAAIPAVDTIAVSEDGRTIAATPKRSTLWQIQTPQTFRLALLRQTFSDLSEAERNRLTDACGIFAARNLPVQLVFASRDNLKLTTPVDLVIAGALLDHNKPEGTPSAETRSPR